jgi:hypothetical protein
VTEQWSIIRPYFKEEFATESDDKLILDGLAHMAMRPTENVRSFFGWINAVNKVIKDAYDSYTHTGRPGRRQCWKYHNACGQFPSIQESPNRQRNGIQHLKSIHCYQNSGE